MNKRSYKKIGACLLLLIVFSVIFNTNTVKTEAVTPSTVDYRVVLKNNIHTFIHNAKSIGSAEDTEYYMTYTVKKVTSVGTQHGVLGTDNFLQSYPYQNGGMMRHTVQENFMLQEGATYFIKVTLSNAGFRYNVTRAKGDTLEDLYFDKLAGSGKADMGYFGLWIAQGAKGDANTTAELTNVRCYDAAGNDLGVRVSSDNVGLVYGGKPLKTNTSMKQYYEIYVSDKTHIAISNKEPLEGNKLYIEYKVESADYLFHQEGVAMSNSPTATYPHKTGQLRYTAQDEPTNSVEMLHVGAEYLVSVEKKSDKFDVLIQRMENGEITTFGFQRSYKTYDEAYQYASLWFSEVYSEEKATFKLTNMKIYDEKGNDLGVQCNRDAVIVRRGSLDNYADCEATYYCKKNNNSLALYKDKSIKFTEDGAMTEGTYQITDSTMTAVFGGEKKEYEYLYSKITDSEGNEYARLLNYKVQFVTGSDTKIPTQRLSNETGYVATKPEDPTLKDCEFLGWCRKDGTEFDFEQYVTESVTLYAKWSGDGGKVFLASESLMEKLTPYLLVGGGTVILVVALIGCALMIQKGDRKREKK